MKKCFVAFAAIIVILTSVTPAYATGAVGGVVLDIVSDCIKWCMKPVTVNDGEDELVAAKNYLDTVFRLSS